MIVAWWLYRKWSGATNIASGRFFIISEKSQLQVFNCSDVLRLQAQSYRRRGGAFRSAEPLTSDPGDLRPNERNSCRAWDQLFQELQALCLKFEGRRREPGDVFRRSGEIRDKSED